MKKVRQTNGLGEVHLSTAREAPNFHYVALRDWPVKSNSVPEKQNKEKGKKIGSSTEKRKPAISHTEKEFRAREKQSETEGDSSREKRKAGIFRRIIGVLCDLGGKEFTVNGGGSGIRIGATFG